MKTERRNYRFSNLTTYYLEALAKDANTNETDLISTLAAKAYGEMEARKAMTAQTMQTIDVTLSKIDGHLYANLGQGDLAEATAMNLTARHAGHARKDRAGFVLYYNAAFAEAEHPHEYYQHAVDTVLE